MGKIIITITRLLHMPSRVKYNLRLIGYYFSKRAINKYKYNLTIKQVYDRFHNGGDIYKYYHHYFWNIAPVWLKNHRHYFSQNQRSFGEDAFHAMWYKIFFEYRPQKILEIGVYRGSTLSLFSLLSVKLGIDCEVHGISPFNSAGDSVSEYNDLIDYYKDVKDNFAYFQLPNPVLHKGYSTDKDMVDFIKSTEWDLIFIDGNHDYKVAKQDFINCSNSLNINGIIVLDDSSLYTGYKPTFLSTAGHPGPSNVADEIDPSKFKEIVAVGHNRVFRKL